MSPLPITGKILVNSQILSFSSSALGILDSIRYLARAMPYFLNYILPLTVSKVKFYFRATNLSLISITSFFSFKRFYFLGPA